MQTFRRCCHIVTATFLAVSLSACGGSGSNSMANLSNVTGKACSSAEKGCTEIYGQATVDGPVAAASVTVLASSGIRIGSGITNANGDFSIYVPEPIKDYSIVVEGGTFKGSALVGSLTSVVRNRPEQGQHVIINPVTTLVSLQMQENPARSYQQSVADVQKFLGIPQAYGIGMNLTPNEFSGKLFAQNLVAEGGVSASSANLLRELNAGKTHFFHENLLRSEGVEIASFVAKGIASGVLGKIGSEAFSSILGWGGSQDDRSSPAAIAAAEAARQQAAKLAQISDQISALSVKLQNVQSSLLAAIDQSSYTTLLGQRVQELVDINDYIDQELRAIATSQTPTLDRRDRLNKYVFEKLVQGGMQSWHSTLYGTVSQENTLLVLWSKIVQKLKTDVYDSSQADAVQAQWDYFDAQQARSLAYVVDYMRGNASYSVADDILPTIQRWRNNRKLQLSLLKGNSRGVDIFYYPGENDVAQEYTVLNYALPNNTIFDRTTNTHWYQQELETDINFVDEPQFLDGLSIATRKVENLTGQKGWQLPASRSVVPHKTGDQTEFDGLLRLKVNISEYCGLLYAETIRQRLNYAKSNYHPGPISDGSGQAYFDYASTGIEDSIIFPSSNTIDAVEDSKWTRLIGSAHDYVFYRYSASLGTPRVYLGIPVPSFIANDKRGPNGVFYNYRACYFLTRSIPEGIWHN